MQHTTSQHRTHVWMRGWHLAAAAALLAVFLQLWGLYRVTGPPQPAWFPYVDKLDHAVGFALPVLLILLTVTLRGVGWQWPSPRTSALIVGVFAAHGVVSEVIQHLWYRHRTGDPFDVIADWAGIAVGVLVFGLILQRRSRGAAEGFAAS
jgi:VanZ family protein